MFTLNLNLTWMLFPVWSSRRGLVGEIISPLWLGRVRVRVMGRVRVKIGFGVGFGLHL